METANVSPYSGDSDVLLQVRDLKKWFPIKAGLLSRTIAHVKAVDKISFDMKRKETFGLVGESGCGKSTLGKVLLRLINPTEGSILLDNQNFLEQNKESLRASRRKVQIVFQDPYSSLNPKMRVVDIIGEPLEIHEKGMSNGDKMDKIKETLELVGLSPNVVLNYPHEFSGGQRQRIAIARALILRPELIVCDEAVSALDVSIRAQILNLLSELQEQFGLANLFISHDLSVVRYLSDKVGVMYLGKIVEISPTEELFTNPLHPYTQDLLMAIPVPDPEFKKQRSVLQGDVPSPKDPPPGCRFHTRCKFSRPICKEEEPQLVDAGNGHYAACHFLNKQ